jgi:hypothetical protein
VYLIQFPTCSKSLKSWLLDSVYEHFALANRILELAKDRVYEGHWEYGISPAVDQQFDDLTELCRRIWFKESKAWLNLAKAWYAIDMHLIVRNDEHI